MSCCPLTPAASSAWGGDSLVHQCRVGFSFRSDLLDIVFVERYRLRPAEGALMRTAVAAVLVSVLLGSPASAQLPQGPPEAFLGSRTGEVQSVFQGFCWREVPPEGICGDNFHPVDP